VKGTTGHTLSVVPILLLTVDTTAIKINFKYLGSVYVNWI